MLMQTLIIAAATVQICLLNCMNLLVLHVAEFQGRTDQQGCARLSPQPHQLIGSLSQGSLPQSSVNVPRAAATALARPASADSLPLVEEDTWAAAEATSESNKGKQSSHLQPVKSSPPPPVCQELLHLLHHLPHLLLHHPHQRHHSLHHQPFQVQLPPHRTTTCNCQCKPATGWCCCW